MRRPVLPAPGGGTTTLFPESVRALAPNLLPQSLCGEERLARARRVGAGGGPSGISSGKRYREAMVMPLRRRFRSWECRAARGRQRHWDRPRGNRFPLIHQGRSSCFRRLKRPRLRPSTTSADKQGCRSLKICDSLYTDLERYTSSYHSCSPPSTLGCPSVSFSVSMSLRMELSSNHP